MFYLDEQTAADFVNKLHRSFSGVTHPKDGLAVESFEYVCLNNILPIVCSPDNQQHPVVVFDHTQHQYHQKGDGASDCSYHIVANTAADTDDNCPEDINAVPAVFDGGTETNDGKCAHHTKRQCNVVADDCHHRSGQHRQNHKRCIEFLAVNRASV